LRERVGQGQQHLSHLNEHTGTNKVHAA
jgi:hypothetical protein